MASRNGQKNKTAKRKQRQQKAWKLYKAANSQQQPGHRQDLHSLSFGSLRQKTKHAIVALLNAVERK